MSRADYNRIQFISAFLAGLVILAFINRWPGPILGAVLIILGIVLVVAVFLIWLFFQYRKKQQYELKLP